MEVKASLIVFGYIFYWGKKKAAIGCTDMRIVVGTTGMPEEPPKKNTLKIKILFASQ